MIDRQHPLPLTYQAEVLQLSCSSLYYQITTRLRAGSAPDEEDR